MIIGINGYIGSGKDTVGKIIQYLDSEKRFQTGVKKLEQEGMTILASYKKPTSFEEWVAPKIHEGYDIGGYALYQDDGYDESWRIKKFAGKLKDIASLMTGIPVEKFEDQEFKKTYLGEEWGKLMCTFDENTNFRNGVCTECLSSDDIEFIPMTVREFLQKLGTEAVREGLHTNAWVNALFADYKQIRPNPKVGGQQVNWVHSYYPNWIITDTRFPNEAQAIKDRGGIVVRVDRDEFIDGYPLTQGIPKHPSETGLDDWNFDYVLENNGSIDDLTQKVKIMLEHFKLL